MEDILTTVMGLDVHRDSIVACFVKGAAGQTPEKETRTFGTLIPEMQKLREWVVETECRNVAMESTGIYWIPIYEMLETCFNGEIHLLVVNARHMKNVPGRKTDMKDAEWIATLLRAGLLKGSFVPEKEFRELRHLTRYRKAIVHDVTSQKNRINKFLQSSGFRFTAFLSDAFGTSGRNIIRHLMEHGSIDREALDKCLKTQTRKRMDEILVALNGTLSEHQWYWRIKQRKGAKRATIALARKLLSMIYAMLKSGNPYDEFCFEARRKLSERKRASRMIHELQKMGYRVEPVV